MLIMRLAAVAVILLLSAAPIRAAAESAGTLELQPLIDEALKNNRDLLAAESKWNASTSRIRQAQSLPDPMVMIGYQNEGWSQYTYGMSPDAQWMFGFSQMFPFPGKRGLKGEMAAQDAGSSAEMYRAQRLKTVSTVKELYFDLFLTYKSIDLVRGKTALFSQVEEAALARYSSGMAPQQEVLMAQAEKFMLLERETMLQQKVQSLEAMLNTVVGRDANAPLGRPVEPLSTPYSRSREEVQEAALAQSPEILSREKMIKAADARVGMAEKEYYPDVTLAGTVFTRPREFQDMWSLTATFNIPLYFGTKQKAVAEAKSLTLGARQDLEAGKLMVASNVRDNYTMLMTAGKLMELYKQGLIPKSTQDVDAALAGYKTGRVEAITVISRLKALLDFEQLYWAQFVEREKAIARLDALTGAGTPEAGENRQ
jgi:outer membrane protein TolC